MAQRRSLSDEQRQAAVELFAAGYGRNAVARRLEVRLHAVRTFHDRWQLWGDEALVATPTKRTYAFELKREIVERFLAGETKRALAQEYALASPQLIKVWAKQYRADGADGLRPKPKGRPARQSDASARPESELERLRRENERLRAENAYLGKLHALIAAERR